MRSISAPGVLLFSVLIFSFAALCLRHSENDEEAQRVSSWCPNAFFNFGDSLSDTGNMLAAEPDSGQPDVLPYGEAFFEKPTGRFSNGRLVIDFMLLAFKLPLLEAYLLPTANKSTHGLNFAYSGATASPGQVNPYFLGYQVDDFVKLKNSVLQAQRQQSFGQSVGEVDQAAFHKALYTICIGGNDIINGHFAGLQPEAIIQDIVPDVVNRIIGAVHTLYSQGARKFMIFNTPPIGCATIMLTPMDGHGFAVDDLGCITAMNEINQVLNKKLFKSVQSLRASLPHVKISYFDYFAANIEILGNPSKYGFNPDVKHTVCCGSPGFGIFNWNPKYHCGRQGSQKCDDPDQYLIWDGVHWTEAFYRHIAKFVLNGQFSDPPTNLTKACNLSFDNFGHNAGKRRNRGQHYEKGRRGKGHSAESPRPLLGSLKVFMRQS